MRYLIEFRPNVFREDWYPVITKGVIAIWDQFADADRVYRDIYRPPTARLIETDETDAQLKARAR